MEHGPQRLCERFIARHDVELEFVVIWHWLGPEEPLPLKLFSLLSHLGLEGPLGLLPPLLALELEAYGLCHLSALDRLRYLVKLSKVRKRKSLELG